MASVIETADSELHAKRVELNGQLLVAFGSARFDDGDKFRVLTKAQGEALIAMADALIAQVEWAAKNELNPAKRRGVEGWKLASDECLGFLTSLTKELLRRLCEALGDANGDRVMLQAYEALADNLLEERRQAVYRRLQRFEAERVAARTKLSGKLLLQLLSYLATAVLGYLLGAWKD